jgi:hypothetical protein
MMEGGVQQIARTFVNVTTCPQCNNNMIIKIKFNLKIKGSYTMTK